MNSVRRGALVHYCLFYIYDRRSAFSSSSLLRNSSLFASASSSIYLLLPNTFDLSRALVARGSLLITSMLCTEGKKTWGVSYQQSNKNENKREGTWLTQPSRDQIQHHRQIINNHHRPVQHFHRQHSRHTEHHHTHNSKPQSVPCIKRYHPSQTSLQELKNSSTLHSQLNGMQS